MGLFDLHHPLVFAFGILGNLVSVFVYLSPLPTFIRICKEKSTLGFQSVPYVVALFSAMLWLYYALLKHATLLISINSLGCVIETIYISIFMFYAAKEPRKHTTKLLAILNVGMFGGVYLVARFAVHEEHRIEVVGWVCVVVSVSVFAAPLSIVLQVVRTRSTEFMPFALSMSLTLSAVMWFCYGLLQKDICVAVPNVLGFILGILQMALYGLYKNAEPIEAEKKVQQPDNGHAVVDIRISPNSDQVHPLDSQRSSYYDDKEKSHVEFSDCDEKNNVVSGGQEDEPCPPANFRIDTPSPVLIVCAA